jgi:2-amino-4-hydroxy-6-hydroxymethyldihydropteridine diphosphokinase
LPQVPIDPHTANPPFDVLLSLGANIGARETTIARAIKLIAASPGIELVRVSSFYETDPVGFLEQPAFINAAVAIRTTRSPERLLGRLRAIERALGRTRRARWHEREIDIDILLYGDRVVSGEHLQIPHGEMHRRRFVLAPLAEIAPGALHPSIGLTVTDLLARCADHSAVRRIDDQSQHSTAS